MARQRLFIILFCVSFAVTAAEPVFAWNARVSAVATCISNYAIANWAINGSFYPHANTLNCGMPNTSSMPHDQVQTLNIHGYSDDSGNKARACLKYWYSASIVCGSWTTLGTGVYGKTISSSVWRNTPSSFQDFPYVEVTSNSVDDAVYGFFLSN